MYQYYLSVGMPEDGDFKILDKAITLLKGLRSTRFLISEFYLQERELYDLKDRSKFCSACVQMDSDLDPFDFLEKLTSIKMRSYGIFLDIVWIGGIEIISNVLRVPDDALISRAFVLYPLKELAKTDLKLQKLIKRKMEHLQERSEKISKFYMKRN